jgi:hypothetical protein
MKLLLAGFAVLAALAIVGVYAWSSAGTESIQTTSSATAPDPRVTRLEAEVAQLKVELARLAAQAELTRSDFREPAETAAAVPSLPAPVGSPLSPSWCLEQYVASFRLGGEGSEYFRLAVEAYVPSLLEDITELVLNGATHPLLRKRLTEMLSDARLAGSARVIDVLLAVLRSSDDEPLLVAALDSLDAIAGTSAVAGLERVLWGLPAPQVRRAALALLVKLYGPGRNLAIARLLVTAPDDAALAVLISLLDPADSVGSLEAFDLASRQTQPVRLHAAGAIANFQGESVVAFVDEWSSFETDNAVRLALGRARDGASRVRGWSPLKATGPADADPSRDDPNAWASAQPDMGLQWLELGYAQPLRCSALRIHEVNAAGAIASVIAFDDSGREHNLWAGSDPLTVPAVFEIPIPTTSYRVKRVRLVLDTNRTPGWNEIDAVQLLGPDGSAWATTATASSSYAGGT